MARREVLIYEEYENEFGFVERDDLNEPMVPTIDRKERPLQIFTWGHTKHKEPLKKCQVHFDVSKFYTKVNSTKDVRCMNGLDKEIQQSIISHPRFGDLVERIVKIIETGDLNCISFVCAHGKHRSVGWAEIIKKYYYPKSSIKHAHFST